MAVWSITTLRQRQSNIAILRPSWGLIFWPDNTRKQILAINALIAFVCETFIRKLSYYSITSETVDVRFDLDVD